jgi:hypothetical protein
MGPPSNRSRRSLAAGLGAALRLLDRASAVLYIAGTFAMAGMLTWYAVTRTLWLLLLAVPMAVTAVLFASAFRSNPELGLHLEWPVRRHRARPRNRAAKPTSKRKSGC